MAKEPNTTSQSGQTPDSNPPQVAGSTGNTATVQTSSSNPETKPETNSEDQKPADEQEVAPELVTYTETLPVFEAPLRRVVITTPSGTMETTLDDTHTEVSVSLPADVNYDDVSIDCVACDDRGQDIEAYRTVKIK